MAVVVIDERSDPIPGSVMATAVIRSRRGDARQPPLLLLVGAVVEEVGQVTSLCSVMPRPLGVQVGPVSSSTITWL